MTAATEFAKANETYTQSFGEKASLALPPSRKVIVITYVFALFTLHYLAYGVRDGSCMDARIDPAASLGIKEGEAHIIRNAGGRAYVARDLVDPIPCMLIRPFQV